MAAVTFIDVVCDNTIKPVIESDPSHNIVICSPGGSLYSGYAMHDSIESKGQTTIAIGIVASAAAVAYAGGKKRLANPNAAFVLHNPSGSTEGTATEMQIAADTLKGEEQVLLNFWCSKLTIPVEEVKALLDADIQIRAEEAVRIGLVHEIIQKNETMNVKLLNYLKTKGIPFKKEPVKNSLTVTPTDGQTYVFPDINTKEEIVAGVAVKDKDNKPFTGEFILQSGETVKCTNGIVDSVEMQMPMMEDEALIDAVIQNSEALSAENEALKVQITNLTAEKEAIKNELTQKITIKDQEIVTIKNQLGKVFPGQNKPIEAGQEGDKKGYVYDPKTNKYTWK